MLLTILTYLLLGAAAGVVAGLFGIGGGLLIVPVLVFSFELQGMSPEVLTHAAVATSLATIVATSLSSTMAHHKRGAVRWDLFKPITFGILLGAFLGVKTAGQMSGVHLQTALGCFAIAVSIQMALNLKPSAAETSVTNPGLVGAGGLIGWLSSIFGIKCSLSDMASGGDAACRCDLCSLRFTDCYYWCFDQYLGGLAEPSYA